MAWLRLCALAFLLRGGAAVEGAGSSPSPADRTVEGGGGSPAPPRSLSVKTSPVKPPGKSASNRATCSSQVMLGGATVRTRGFLAGSDLSFRLLIFASSAIASSAASCTDSIFDQKALA